MYRTSEVPFATKMEDHFRKLRVRATFGKEYLPPITESTRVDLSFHASLFNGLIHEGFISSTQAQVGFEAVMQYHDLFDADAIVNGSIARSSTGIVADVLDNSVGFEDIVYRRASRLYDQFRETLAEGRCIITGNNHHGILLAGFGEDRKHARAISPYIAFDPEKQKKNSLSFLS